MRKLAPARRLFILAAAYLVVLQAVLLPLAVAAGSPFANSLCLSSSEAGHSPAAPNTGCACAAGCGMCCAPALMDGPLAASVAMVLDFVTVSTPSALPVAVAATHRRTPQNPRAPPSV